MDQPSPSFLRQRLPGLIRRGLVAVAALAALALMVAGVLLLRVDFDAAEREAVARLEQQAGLKVSFRARTLSRFPVPGIRYDALVVRHQAGRTVLEAPQAQLRYSLLDLLDGRLDAPHLKLTGATATLDAELTDSALRSPRALIALIERIGGAFDQQSAFAALEISAGDGRIRLARGTAEPAVELGPLAFVLEYSAQAGQVALRLTQAGSGRPDGSAPLAQQQLKLALRLPTQAALSPNRARPFQLEGTLGDSTLSYAGKARLESDLVLAGKLEAALGDTFERLLGWQREAREGPSRLAGALTLDARGASFETLALQVGRRSLSGIAALRENNARWALSATLAGDLVDGTAAYRVLQSLREPNGAWSEKPLALNPLPGLDLDLRISTRAFRLGRFLLDNVALSVLTRAARAEMAIVDSRFGDGTFKARVMVGETENGEQTLRLSTSGEQIEGGALLDQAFGFDRVTGAGSFVIQAQGHGTGVASIIRSLNGTAALDLNNGVVSGIDLNRLMNRAAEQRAETALLFSLVGKTPYESLRADFSLREGRMETVGSRFITPTVDALMEGVSDIANQRHQQSLVLRKRAEDGAVLGEFFGFRMEGGLFSPAIKPDNKLLQDKR